MIRSIVAIALWVGWSSSGLFGQESSSPSQGARSSNPSPVPPPASAPFDARQAAAHQAAWATHLGTTVESSNSIGTKMVLIPPGEFLMGSSEEQVAAALKMAAEIKAGANTEKRIRETERPQHRVAIAGPFRLAATEVTIGQFKTFVAATKYVTLAEKLGSANTADPKPAGPREKEAFNWRSPGFVQTDDDAVSQVTWDDAVAFCNWLSEQEKLQPCYCRNAKTTWEPIPRANGYRLPTEAEWEYACRAGTTTQYSFGDDYRELEKYGWFGLKSGSKPVRSVGSKLPNAFGLYDMHGNLFEWCQDRYDPRSYEKPAAAADSAVPLADSNRVMRGGDWFGNAIRCRSAFRGYGAQITRSDDVGFRLLLANVKPSP